jgi:carbonic anhydrase/acetyltransferase-like protein (isoleucine patch superfamily)
MTDDRRAEFARRFPGAIILPYDGRWPEIDDSVFVAPGAVVIGHVEIGPETSVFFHATVRGDIAPIRIGARSNVQDGAILHVNRDAPCIIGSDVTIGHGAIVHGTRIDDAALIGMGSIVMSYSTIGQAAVVAAGALVPERAVVKPGTVVVGVPAKERSALDPGQQAELEQIAGRYVGVAANYRAIMRGFANETHSGGMDGD